MKIFCGEIKFVFKEIFFSKYRVQVKSTAKMASWLNVQLFRLKLSPNQTQNVHFGIFGGQKIQLLSLKFL
jgi:hypothetical protein